MTNISTHTKAGIYTYNISEKTTLSTNYDYDKSVYTVTVTVTDNSEGVLSAKTSILKNGMESSEIAFRNGFVPTPITFDISDEFGGTKLLDGRPVKEGEFEFKLINAINGKQIGETVKNVKEGDKNVFKFPQITIREAGTYHYKITEVIGDEKGVSYDTAYTVMANVIDNLDGTFRVEYSYIKGTEIAEGVIFTNVYTAPLIEPETQPEEKPETKPESDIDIPKTGDNSNVWMLFALMFISSTVLFGTAT